MASLRSNALNTLPGHCVCRRRDLTSLTPDRGLCYFVSPLAHCLTRYRRWQTSHPDVPTRDQQAMLALLEDSCLLCRVVVRPPIDIRSRLRWQQLEMADLSDIQLFTIVLDNLFTIRDQVAVWNRRLDHADLSSLLADLRCLTWRIEVLLDPARGMRDIVRMASEAGAREDQPS
ncbi:hypothetical protein L861_06390 [Litchfieldella anticariensis FP35 = DSM 16096]|uniref:Uncharacterized protein n=1 Tax=Litchfieldella anticariensis (strain DSM 16096 / CECT 5854 / CIP 108499 / LMG 22089 / FP35) TaxID=1121939 RepID=S2KEE8_LITA3|nr:hypothetical protein [Halomonas anticariensis]EPC00562.1 hypothetical protein L861_06390 [Halomonas anticariensis FP35 = DSM 16096]